MKIITWNCNGALRKKFQSINKYNADIYVIQECENPAETSHLEYKEWAINYLWVGDNKNKGIGVFAKKNILLEQLNWTTKCQGEKVKHFLPCKINNEFILLGVWTHQNNSSKFGYIGQFWKYLQVHKKNLKNATIVGDFNSNSIWDRSNRHWNHTDVVQELIDIGLYSYYHLITNENQGKETIPTFYLHRNIEKSYHLDYIFGNKEIRKLEVGEIDVFLKISDHLPIFCDINM